MAVTLKFRRGTAAPTASLFAAGEPAWDAANSKLYVKNNAGAMVCINPVANPADDANVVHITGTETITGAKTFSSNVTLSGPNTSGGRDTLMTLRNTANAANSGSGILFQHHDGTSVVPSGRIGFRRWASSVTMGEMFIEIGSAGSLGPPVVTLDPNGKMAATTFTGSARVDAGDSAGNPTGMAYGGSQQLRHGFWASDHLDLYVRTSFADHSTIDYLGQWGLGFTSRVGIAARLHVRPTSTSGTPIIAQGLTSQTAPLFQALQSGGGVAATISNSANLTLGDGTTTSGSLTIKSDTEDIFTVSDADFGTMALRANGPHAQGIIFRARSPISGNPRIETTEPYFTLEFNSSLTVVGSVTVTDEAYGSSWNGSTQVPTKNALYDKIEALAVSPAVAGGSNTHIQYNNSGSLAGSANFTYSSGIVTVCHPSYSSGQLKIKPGDGAGLWTGSTATVGLAFTEFSGGNELAAIFLDNSNNFQITTSNNLNLSSDVMVRSRCDYGFKSRNRADTADAPITGSDLTLSGSISQGTGGNHHMGYGRALSWSSTGAGYNMPCSLMGVSGNYIQSIASYWSHQGEFRTGNSSVYAKIFAATDAYNPIQDAMYVTPSVTSTRLIFGQSTNKWFSLNLENVVNVEKCNQLNGSDGLSLFDPTTSYAITRIGSKIYHHVSGPDNGHVWSTVSGGTYVNLYSGTTKMELTQAGRLLIGMADDGGNALQVAGNVRATGMFTTFPGTGKGYVNIQAGTTSHQGWVEWYRPSGARSGYMGYENNRLGITMDSGVPFVVVESGADQLTISGAVTSVASAKLQLSSGAAQIEFSGGGNTITRSAANGAITMQCQNFAGASYIVSNVGGSGSTIPLLVKMATGQSANPFEVQNSSNMTIMSVSPSGEIRTPSINFGPSNALGGNAYLTYDGSQTFTLTMGTAHKITANPASFGYFYSTETIPRWGFQQYLHGNTAHSLILTGNTGSTWLLMPNSTGVQFRKWESSSAWAEVSTGTLNVTSSQSFLHNTASGGQTDLVFTDAGTSKMAISKGSDNSLSIYNYTAAGYQMYLRPDLTSEFNGRVSFITSSSAAVTENIRVSNVGTGAGTGARVDFYLGGSRYGRIESVAADPTYGNTVNITPDTSTGPVRIASSGVWLPNGMSFDILSGLSRVFTGMPIFYQSNATSTQHRFLNSIGTALTTGAVVEVGVGASDVGTGVDMIRFTGTASEVLASVTKTGAMQTAGGFYHLSGTNRAPADIELTRTLSATVGATVELGNFYMGNGAHNVRVTITCSLGSNSVAKSYILASYYGHTSAAWTIVNPIESTGAYGSEDFVLEANHSGFDLTLRVRKTGGSIGGTIQARIEYTGSTGAVWTPSTTTSTSSVTAIHPSTPLTQLNGKVGIGTTNPQYTLDVVGNISGTWVGDTIPINRGGSGQTSANAALNAFLPSQTGHAGKVLSTDGSNTSWVTMSGGGGGISDGDKGDITVSSSGTVWTIDNSAVTLAKIANIATATFLGRNTASSGVVEELSITTAKTMLGLTGTNSGDQTITLTGDVTGSGTSSFSATIGNNVVTLAKMQQITTASVLGRSTAGTGNIEVLTASAALTLIGGQAADTDLTNLAALSTSGLAVRNNTGSVWLTRTLTAGSSKISIGNGDGVSANPTVDVVEGNLTIANISGSVPTTKMPALTGDVTTSAGFVATTIANNVVTFAKMQQISTSSILGRTTVGTGNIEALTGSQARTIIGAQTADTDLTNLAALATSGIAVRNNTGSAWVTRTLTAGSSKISIGNGDGVSANPTVDVVEGNLTIANIGGSLPTTKLPALTGDVSTTAGSAVTTIANDAVTNAKAANMATETIKGRATAGTGDPEDLTPKQARKILRRAKVTITTTTGTYTLDVTDGLYQTVTLTGNWTLGFPTVTPEEGETVFIYVKQPASGGPRTIGFGTGYQAPGGLSSITLSTAANAVDRIELFFDSATTATVTITKDIKA